MNEWMNYSPGGEPHDFVPPPLPPWRVRSSDDASGDERRGRAFEIDEDGARIVNAALYLRRPLLVTGKPGTGKSTLAYSIAWKLRLGTVLRWPIQSRTTLKDGLYSYDAIGRLQQRQLHPDALPPIEDFLSLGPLGTALAPSDKPRVLLIDEIDKSDIDLPNDLLDVFEEGAFEIPELRRLKSENPIPIRLSGSDATTVVTGGVVRCTEYPIVVLTSNGERDFPPAFLRRCVRLDLNEPSPEQLENIVRAFLQEAAGDETAALIADFVKRRGDRALATDQLLNAIYLVMSGVREDDSVMAAIYRAISET